MSICLQTIDSTDCLVRGVPWCSMVLQMCTLNCIVSQMCRACVRSISSVSSCVTLSYFMCFMCRGHVHVCAQCVKCVTSVCTCVPLTCIVCPMCFTTLYCVPNVFRWYLQCAWCVTVCHTMCGAVLPCVFAVFACVCTLLYLLIQACRPRVSWLMHSMMSYMCSYDTKVLKFVVYLYSSYMARWWAPVNVTSFTSYPTYPDYRHPHMLTYFH